MNLIKEVDIEYGLVGRLRDLKYTYRKDIRNLDALEQNFRKKFEALNRVHLTDSEFEKLREEIVNPDVFTSSNYLRKTNTFTREDGTPLHYTLVNTKDWCKNDFEVINQLRINTKNSNHRYDVIILINGVPVVQIWCTHPDLRGTLAWAAVLPRAGAADRLDRADVDRDHVHVHAPGRRARPAPAR